MPLRLDFGRSFGTYQRRGVFFFFFFWVGYCIEDLASTLTLEVMLLLLLLLLITCITDEYD